MYAKPLSLEWGLVEVGEHITLINVSHVAVVFGNYRRAWCSNFLLDSSVIPINLTQRLHANIIGQDCDNTVVLPSSNEDAIRRHIGWKAISFSIAVPTYWHPYWDLKYSAKPMLVR
ncbi:hypothetical protein E2C01_043125 [Portunus trituberculatus]|uniref:Uncharacterized protein n=1 Tax=Portunus trituberculatus TaxID=210409 RepID=A0A5B7FWN5_PORTR|nr:hypothetical protein [Portunus trituberculatus]